MIQQKRNPEYEKTAHTRAEPSATKKATARAQRKADSVDSGSNIEEHAPSSLGVVNVVADGSADAQGSAASKSLGVELQQNKCNAGRYQSENFTRCTACIRKAAGEACRFQRLRFLLRSPTSGKIVGFSFGESQAHDSPPLDMPNKWNTNLQMSHIERVKGTVAAALLPVLKEEMLHFQLPELIRRPRETEVRATCDACMTSIFSSSWMCRTCGREACFDCFAYIKEVAGSADPPEPIAMTPPLREQHHRNPFFLPCAKRNRHQPKDFSPVTRFCETELAQAIKEMEALLASSGIEPSSPSEDRTHDTGTPPLVTPPPSGRAPGDSTTTDLPSLNLEPAEPPAPLPVPSSSRGTESSTVYPVPNEEAIPSHDTTTFSHTELTEENFRQVWSSGDPLVVTGVLEKFRVQWTPEYFCNNYGRQRCTIVECQSETMKEVTVDKFFSQFGNYENRSTSNWKLKDWPPSADFKTTFPELYDEFVRVTPVPNYVRRDGVLNIASHFPSNAVGPDLGPKMYNAQASFEAEGSKGSTRLHLDMADAVNIMTYASARADGSPGCAAWDIFKVGDTTKLREFLHRKFDGLYHGDPIHAQKFYLDAALRAELYREHGVVSHRIYQKPGEVVFIPAGCAHQVCNLADCIKVACDFVSPENVERCGVLTREFREQNQLKAWKEDVLQLRTMMWFAWLSCVAQEKRLREPEAKVDDDTSPPPGPASAEQPASASSVAASAVPSEPPAQANGSLSTHPVPIAGPSAPSVPSDEGAGSFTFVRWEPSREADRPASTLPVPLLTPPPNEADGDRPPTSMQAMSPAPLGAHFEHPTNSLETLTLSESTFAAESFGVSSLGASTSTPIADILAPPSAAENVILNGATVSEPSAAPVPWSGEAPMAVDSTSTSIAHTEPGDTAAASAGLKHASSDADLDAGPPAKRHKAEVGAEPAAELEVVPAAA